MANRDAQGRFLPGNDVGYAPGESGNPGGQPENTRIVAAVRRILDMTESEYKTWKPETVKEALALKLVRLAGGKTGEGDDETDVDPKVQLRALQQVIVHADGLANRAATQPRLGDNQTVVVLHHGRPNVPMPGSPGDDADEEDDEQ